MTTVQRAKMMDKFMTGVFYIVAGFFLLLLLAFTLYVLIQGFGNFTPDMFSFSRNGIGNLFFNTIYLVFLSLLISVPLGVAAYIYGRIC